MFWFQKRHEWKDAVRHPQQAVPSCDLWDLVLDMDWDLVMEHCKEHPQDAEWVDGHWHETPIYLACQHNAPLPVVQAILRACPKAVLSPSRANKDLPIHTACRYQLSEDILEELLRDYPVTAVEQTRWGRTPLMTLWEFRTNNEDENGRSGSDGCDEALWRKMFIVLQAVARFREYQQYQDQVPRTRKRLFRADVETSKFDCGGPTVPSVVHAAVSMGSLSCPFEALEISLTHFPEQASQRDRWYQLPLHIAVGPTQWNPSTRRQYKPRERDFISLLLKANPKAASERIVTDQNRYPLHTALSNRHTWNGGVECIFHAAPEVLMTPDPITGLYPFQLAAIPIRDTEVDLDTVYKLLRSRPDVLNSFDYRNTSDFSQQCMFEPSTRKMKTKSRRLECPKGLEDALLGTFAALSIGGFAGVIFGRTW